MKFLKKIVAGSNEPDSFGSKFRSRRFEFFEQIFRKAFVGQDRIHILDLGGTEEFWKEKNILKDERVKITILNLQAAPVEHPALKIEAGDATKLSNYGDQSFDLVFSNSVIEHLFTFKNQQKMAEEIKRVGKRYYVQTPNKYFFIEPHYALPFFQFLPSRFVYFILTNTTLSRMHRWDPAYARSYLEEIRLLSLKEMKSLFPGSKIYREKFLGMDESFTMYNF